jgi:hypothetical protein
MNRIIAYRDNVCNIIYCIDCYNGEIGFEPIYEYDDWWDIFVLVGGVEVLACDGCADFIDEYDHSEDS